MLKRPHYPTTEVLILISLGILFFLSLLVISIDAEATVFTSTQTGDWDDGATWGMTSPGVEGTDFPGSLDDGIIADTHTVTLTGAQTTGSLSINSGGTFADGGYTLTVDDVDGTGYSIDLDGSLTCTGKIILTYTAGNTLIDIISGSEYFEDFECAMTGRICQFTGSSVINGDFTLSGGGFKDGGSNAALTVNGHILISGGTLGRSIMGTVTAQSMTLTGGTYDASPSTVITSATGEGGYALWNDGGSITPNSGKFTIGTGDYSNVYIRETDGGMTLYDLDIDSSLADVRIFSTTSLTISNNLTIIEG